jgi:hypothetical protein
MGNVEDVVTERLVALPQDEQVARGRELLQILQEQTELSDSCGAVGDSEASTDVEDGDLEDVDVEVIVKHTFIEVVDPTLKRRQRSQSDTGLFSSPTSASEQSRENVQTLQKIQDWSDASTEDLDAGFSDDDGPADVYTPVCSPPQYACQWVPMGFDADSVMRAPTLEAHDHFLPMDLSQHSLVAYGETFPASMEHMCWADQSIEQEPVSQEWRTTVMLRNMPNNYTRDMFVELVDSMGFAGTYDFAYLPIDFKSQAGLGYAFINFLSGDTAKLSFEIFEGFRDWTVPSEKVCTVTWSSPYQGLESHIERYRNSPVMHHGISDAWKPILLSHGERVPFPAPTKSIKAPKIRHAPSPQSCA